VVFNHYYFFIKTSSCSPHPSATVFGKSASFSFVP